MRRPYKRLSEQRGMPWPHLPGARPNVRVRSATIKPTAPLMIEVRAVKGAIVYSLDDMEIPGDQFIYVERTPHIMLAIREGDLEQRPRPPEQPTAKDAAALPKVSNPATSNPIARDPEAAGATAITPAPERATERLEAPASEDDPEAKAATMLAGLLLSDPDMSKETAEQRLKEEHGIVLGVRAFQRVLLEVRGKGKPGRKKGSKNKKSQHRVIKS